MNVSFYLLTPQAKTQSQLYVSISNKSSRLRFATGEEFLIKYCNSREKKGDKMLVKRNTPFTLEYNSILNSISDNLRLLAMQLQREKGEYSLVDVRNIYWTRIGWIDDKNQVTFANAFEQYKEASRIHWSVEFYKIQCAMENHLTEFKKARNESVEFQNFNEDLWESIISYFVLDLKTANSTTNKYLKSLKRFLKYSAKKGYFNGKDLDDWKYLKEHEVFKIALKEHEVEKLINLDLSASKRLEKVRDLFLLEIFTGQRFSDVHKVLDRENYDGKSIRIFQEKTNALVAIPKHSKLENHLDVLFEKYPQGFPVISNQKFNDYLKEICELAKFNQRHQWVKLVGKQKVAESDFRYNLITSHTGRRTFCTIALKKGIDSELIMKVTGHKNYEQFRAYVKVDDEDLETAFSEKF